MYCPSCGNDLADDAKFCGACGTRIQATRTPVVQDASARQQTPTPHRNHSVPLGQNATQDQGAVYQSAVHQTPSVHNTPNMDPGATVMTAPKGALGQAWSDITSSPKWFSRILLLIIMNCVPILNCFSLGYMLQWGADASRGTNPTLPKGAFDLHCFLSGLFYGILSLLMSIGLLWTVVLGFIPIIGWIASIAISLFATTFTMLAAMRMAVYKRFGKAFDLSELFRKYKSSLGSLFAAAIVPNIAVGICILVLVLLIVGAGGAFWASSMPSLGYMTSYAASDNMLNTLLVGAGAGIILIVLVALLAVFCYGFAQLWALRAVGVWVSRNAAEWQQEAEREQNTEQQS